MGRTAPILECELGEYQFQAFLRDETSGEIMQYAWSRFPIDSTAQRIMNRAARDVIGVAGIIVVDNTAGTTFAVILDNYIDVEQLPGKLALLMERIDERYDEYTQATPASLIEQSMAVHSGTGHWDNTNEHVHRM